jgi:hypothetical protein
MEKAVAKLEERLKGPVQEAEQADVSAFPTHARAPHVAAGCLKNRRSHVRGRASGPEHGVQAVILRLDDVPANPRNVERIRERIRLLNRQLADSGTPFQLRVI